MRTLFRSRSALHRTLIVAVALLFVGLVAACGDDDSEPDAAVDDSVASDESTSTPPAEAAQAEVTAAGSMFDVVGPVEPGAEVTFANEDSFSHTMTAEDSSFDTGTVEGGSSATITAPTEPGDYAFFCEIHPQMQATLTVSAD